MRPFASLDSPEKILAYYRKSLPSFDFKDFGDGDIVFIHNRPEDPDPLDFNTFYLTPHVSIMEIEGDRPGLPSGVEALIEIFYKP